MYSIIYYTNDQCTDNHTSTPPPDCRLSYVAELSFSPADERHKRQQTDPKTSCMGLIYCRPTHTPPAAGESSRPIMNPGAALRLRPGSTILIIRFIIELSSWHCLWADGCHTLQCFSVHLEIMSESAQIVHHAVVCIVLHNPFDSFVTKLMSSQLPSVMNSASPNFDTVNY